MSDIAETYQEQQAQEPKTPQAQSFATVTAVHADGLGLRFDGETEASQKHYKCNQYCKFAAGQRVYIQKDGGTYVVLFPVGDPAISVSADSASAADVADGLKNQNGGGTIWLRVSSNKVQWRGRNTSWADI